MTSFSKVLFSFLAVTKFSSKYVISKYVTNLNKFPLRIKIVFHIWFVEYQKLQFAFCNICR